VGIGVQKWLLTTGNDWHWAAWWLCGAALVGLLASLVWTRIVGDGELDAALEIDRRFSLKERVSSALALSPEQWTTPWGQALTEDAVRHLSRLQIAERFPVTVSRRILLPIVPAIIAVALWWLINPTHSTQAMADIDRTIAISQLAQAVQPLEKHVDDRAKEAAKKGLSDAAELFKKIAEEIRNLAKTNQGDRHEMLAKLHDISQELADRAEQIRATDELKHQLAALKDIPSGPVDKLMQELKNGNFDKAAEEAESLREQLAHGQIGPEQQKSLAKQMATMKGELQKFIGAHQKLVEQLQQKIDASKQAHDLQTVQKLQEQLAKLKKQETLIDADAALAEAMSHLAISAQQENVAEAQSTLEQLAGQLAKLERQDQEMELLTATVDDIDGAKLAMNSRQGGTESSAANRASGTEGIGHHEGAEGTPSDVVQAKTFDAPVKQSSANGSEVAAGYADGPNLKAKALEQIKTQIQAARSESADPVTTEQLPRLQREQVRQYFDAFRESR
jgi:Skp family chaperone for outer membrane proteins